GGHTVADVEGHVNLCIDNGMTCDLAINGGKSVATYLRDDIYDMLKPYEAHLLLHALGEPGAPSPIEWVENSATGIQQLRERGWQAPIYCVAPSDGRDLKVGLDYGQMVVD